MHGTYALALLLAAIIALAVAEHRGVQAAERFAASERRCKDQVLARHDRLDTPAKC